MIAAAVARHVDHGSNHIGIAVVLLTALVVVLLVVVYARRPPKQR